MFGNQVTHQLWYPKQTQMEIYFSAIPSINLLIHIYIYICSFYSYIQWHDDSAIFKNTIWQFVKWEDDRNLEQVTYNALDRLIKNVHCHL